MIRKKIAGLLLAAGLLGMMTMTACLKTSNSSTQTVWTYSTIINAYPDSTGMVFYDGSSKVDTTRFPLGFWSVLRDVPTTHSYNFRTYKTDSLVCSITGEPFDSLTYHTLIAYGTKATGGKLANLEEDFANIRGDSANVRFFNFCDSTGPVDVFINTVKVFSSRDYTPRTGFFPTWTTFPGSTNATVEVKPSGKDSLICKATMNLYTANVYQLVLAGYLHGVGTEKVGIYSAGYSTY